METYDYPYVAFVKTTFPMLDIWKYLNIINIIIICNI